ncbi:ATP-dependent Clp protease ATP-binding subunit ClpX [Striga asiatica]|uniref:ATP-dependent Clp protease ATP-binding subunit ClpX n=1 Tax=Striga asiatica TaxID=4170 RepID=A0A5A7PMV5_STRAF|nr:ATP-dependent Clp protease ATP-binding subunit ClpX [Striga asiatica]
MEFGAVEVEVRLFVLVRREFRKLTRFSSRESESRKDWLLSWSWLTWYRGSSSGGRLLASARVALKFLLARERRVESRAVELFGAAVMFLGTRAVEFKSKDTCHRMESRKDGTMLAKKIIQLLGSTISSGTQLRSVQVPFDMWFQNL